MHRGIMAQDMDKMLDCLGFTHIPATTKFLIALTEKTTKPHPISGENGLCLWPYIRLLILKPR